MNETPTLETVIDRAFRVMARGLHTAQPGYIQDYDATRREASVLLANQRADYTELGDRVLSTRGVIPHVPVYFPGGGGASSTFPIRRGDSCLVVFASSPTGVWKQRGGVVDPGDDSTNHHLSDAFAFVGFSSFAEVKAAHATAVVVGDGASDLRLGSQSAGQAVLLGTAFRSASDVFLNAMATFVSALAGLPGMSGPAATFNAAVVTYKSAIDDALSTIVKVA